MPASLHCLHDNDLSIEEKFEKIVREIHRGSKVNFEKETQTQIREIVKTAGTSYQSVWLKRSTASLNPAALGVGKTLEITIRELVPKLEWLIVALTGDVMTMIAETPCSTQYGCGGRRHSDWSI